jgi:hypothetical protein
MLRSPPGLSMGTSVVAFPPLPAILAAMSLPTRLTFACACLVLMAACQSSGPSAADIEIDVPTLTDAMPVPVESGKTERFVIRDTQKRVRVDGRVDSGRMTGTWVYYDSYGEKLAVVSYRLDQRHGPVQLYYVTADGPAVRRLRMTGEFVNGAQNGMLQSRWPSGGKKLERDFDQGILQGARGWTEKGGRMEDGTAMAAAIKESRDEDALLAELESFVQLQMRKQAATNAGERVPELELEIPSSVPPASNPGGLEPLPNP